MGLLDFLNSAEAQTGLGLLAAAGPRSDGAGFGQRLLEGLSQGDRWKAQQAAAKRAAMQDEMQQMQMAQAQTQMQQQQKLQGLASQFSKPAVGMAADGYGPSAPASFDREGYGAALEGIDPIAGRNYLQGLQKDNSPLTVSEGQTLLDRNTLKPIYSNVKPKEIDPNKPFMVIDGKIVPNEAYQNFDLRSKRAGATNVSLANVGPKAFETELGKMDAEQLGEWRKGAMNAQSTLGTVKRLEEADAKGAYSGGAANLKMTVGSYLNGITGATPKGQVGSELYNAEAKKLVLESIKTLGANPSNADREFIEQTVPQLSTNADARRQLTVFMREKANQAIGLYERANSHARKNSGLGGFNVVEPTNDIDALVNKYK